MDNDFGSLDLVLHDGSGATSADACVKCYQSPPAVKMVSPGKCFLCHGAHCLAFGELPWAVPFLQRSIFVWDTGQGKLGNLLARQGRQTPWQAC